MTGMKSQNLKDAMKECSNEPQCDMFVDIFNHDVFYYCSKPDAKIEVDFDCTTTLYEKGNSIILTLT